MKVRLLLVPSLVVSVFAVAEVLPAARRIDWSASGIPGGIPHRTTVCGDVVTGYGAKGDDATDNRAAFQQALDACAAGQVVTVPAGIFRIKGSLSMPSNVTLRGAGPATVIKSVGTGEALFIFGADAVQYDPSSISTAISSGATAGSQSLVVASNTGITVGSYLVITELNDPSFVSIQGTLNGPATWVDSWTTQGTRARGQIVEVTSVSGTTIGITPGLYSAYTRTPWATRFSAGVKWAGVERLKTFATNSGTNRNFLFQKAAYSWVTEVESDSTDGDHVTIDWSYRCEIRKNHFHDAFIHEAGQFDNMVGLRNKTSATLVIDNIIRRLHVAVMTEWGAAGNVIAYNYDRENFDAATAAGNRWLPVSMNSNHGAHPQFNLFEGNVSQKFQADAYWGSSSHCTVFRNWFSGTGTTNPPYTGRGPVDTGTTATLIQANRAIDVWELQSMHSLLGNIVGSAPLVTRGLVRRVTEPASRGYDNPPVCFSYGYTSESDSGGTSAKTSPTTTLIEHGNFDFATNAVVWDSTNADHALPDSLFLSAKPAWFGSLKWPPVDPITGAVSETMIPAGYRFVNGIDPPGGGSDFDAGSSVDAGSFVDAGSSVDAGTRSDAGQAPDAGLASSDAGPQGGGPVSDAGSIDGGAGGDARPVRGCGCATEPGFAVLVLGVYALRRRPPAARSPPRH